MSGHVIQIAPKQVLDFTNVASGFTGDVILADRLSVVSWRELTLRVQVHTHTLVGGGGFVQVLAFPRSWTPEDPGLVFLDGLNAWGVTVNSATLNPAFLQASIPTAASACVGHMTRIIARGSRTTTGSISTTVSVDLSTKDA